MGQTILSSPNMCIIFILHLFKWLYFMKTGFYFDLSPEEKKSFLPADCKMTEESLITLFM